MPQIMEQPELLPEAWYHLKVQGEQAEILAVLKMITIIQEEAELPRQPEI